MKFNRPYFSYSSYARFASCAMSYKFRYIDRLKDPSGAAADRGTAMHAMGENYVVGKIIGVPKVLTLFKREFAHLRKVKAEVEQWRRANIQWRVCRENDAWVVAKLDANLIDNDEAVVIDYKSGRIYAEKHAQQGSLYAVLEHAYQPQVDNVHVEFWYLDQKGPDGSGRVLTWDYSVEALAVERERWTERGMEVLTATKFPASPSQDNCRWCNFHKMKGGPCKEGYEWPPE